MAPVSGTCAMDLSGWLVVVILARDKLSACGAYSA